jgi:hypothetical protein
MVLSRQLRLTGQKLEYFPNELLPLRTTLAATLSNHNIVVYPDEIALGSRSTGQDARCNDDSSAWYSVSGDAKFSER